MCFHFNNLGCSYRRVIDRLAKNREGAGHSERVLVFLWGETGHETPVPKLSAGILLFRKRPAGVQVLLVHPGGPFWANKDEGAWSIPKGLADEAEDLLAAAKREFFEETGATISGEFIDLGAHKQPGGGKMIVAWGCESGFDPELLKSNTFTIEWPPRSGKTAEFPEVNRAGWFSFEEALKKATNGQRPIIAALAEKLGIKPAKVSR